MQEHDLSFVRAEMVIAQAPPVVEHGALGWVRRNLFATPGDAILTLIGIAIVALAAPPLVRWLFVEAQWTGTGRTFCTTAAQGGIQPNGWSGACWAFVSQKFQQFIFGRYPVEERWRVLLVAVLLIALLVPLLMPRVPAKGLNALLLGIAFPVVAFFLLLGGGYPAIEDHFVAILSVVFFVAILLAVSLSYFGKMPVDRVSLYVIAPVALFFFLIWLSSRLPYVETPLWGGLMITLVLSFVGIVVSLPAGILLALGRRSQLPVVKSVCVAFIELIRGVPLVTVLFMASVMLPLFLPAGMTFDKLMRALVGVSLFSSAYMAEVIRGGLQAIPKGQYEGADSLGLSYSQKMGLVILPQALKLVIPGIVSEFIGLFKDTSLVYIIGMFDLLGTVRQNFADAAWATPQTPMTGLVFAGFVYWLFCFAMSRYSQFMERRLDTGHRR